MIGIKLEAQIETVEGHFAEVSIGEDDRSRVEGLLRGDGTIRDECGAVVVRAGDKEPGQLIDRAAVPVASLAGCVKHGQGPCQLCSGWIIQR